MIKPTRLAVTVFAAGIPPALILAVRAPHLWPLSLVYGIAVLTALAGDAFAALSPRDLAIDPVVPDRLYIGDRGEIGGALAVRAQRRSIRFQILPEQTGVLDPPQITDVMLEPGGGGARFAISLVPRRRGQIRIERLWIRWRGPLSLVEITHHRAIARTIDVLANVRGVQSAALQFFSREAIFGSKVQRERGQGTEFDALREYLPGMDSRFIDWKHSARHRKLLSKEFDTERNHQIVMAFDTGYLMREPVNGLAKLDHAINAGLLLAWISLRGGDLVGIYGFDVVVRHYLRPIRTLASFGRIQQAVAALDYRAEETNFTLGLAELNVRLRRRALVILFTDFVDTTTAELLIESLQRIANRHVVLFVTLKDAVLQDMVDTPPAKFDDVTKSVIAHDMLRDRGIVLERLERLGIHCLDVTTSGLSAGLINRYLTIKQRGLI
jgi:uncharacterized protein (DUF58 family)